MRKRLARQLAEARSERERRHRQRRRQTVEVVGPGLQVRVDGQRLIDFCSNDYLGFGHEVPEGSQQRSSASSSPLVCGHGPIHGELEARLAEFLGTGACALFPSGYQANLAVGQALGQRGQAALADRLNHASLNDGLRLAGSRILRYAHADARAAAERWRPECRLLVTDSVFSMDGDLAPLAELAELVDARDLAFWVDDAHGFGVLGTEGRGAVEACGLEPDRVDVLVITFGKALGTAGAVVAGDPALIEHLENEARGLIYSTGLAPALAEWTLHKLVRLQREPQRRERLRAHIERFRDGCARAGVALSDSSTPIQILPLGGDQRALALAEQLQQAGFLIRAIRPPTVPEGSARLRITLSSEHSPQDIDRLCATLGQLTEAHPGTDSLH
ncbi:aminotransferase class I/II-fold pyridoxal phosphate-dependent enzyme [Wenzhouxiangella marina]|uniref:8-amino-7-oxononanoate synthase n=1 Tax=Wenzhouxiangella marina TaxID=1579979 RepID=A0A0K0XZT2_9GAMM|nr:8-amino-7-oxononanoate synthase [Wenzhouxiangella marina]AKS43180.1 8-amino-7-oxononanoate synthase [Wenzhouxiangella marina]MBB6087135.1 8-amino-7-oxononanoate synthase [Wenzhouxiangella marina]